MLNATVIKRENITDELMIIHVLPDAGVGEFLPGQYVALGLPGSAPRPAHFPPDKEEVKPDKLVKRAYSIGSSPLTREYLEFYIAVVPDGALTSRLALIKEGDRLFAAPKITGTFTIDSVPSEENLIMISTGTGIAPYLAMLRTPNTWTAGRAITLVHGVRFARDLAYREELEAFAATQPGFRYFPIVSRADPEWHGDRGHLQTLFHSGKIGFDPARDHFFLCGNPAMIDEMEKMLLEKGYAVHGRKNPTGRLHLEKYW